MPVDIIVGGSGGTRAKGKICAYLACKGDYKYSIKSAGLTPAHGLYKGRIYALKSIPAGFCE